MLTRKLMTGMAVLALLMATTAGADTFTLNKAALLQLWDVFENPANATTALTAIYDGPGIGYEKMSGQVGFVGTIFDSDGLVPSPFASMGIGANFWGTSSTGSGATTAQVIGAALGTAPTNDLTAFDTYSLYLENDNDDTWYVNIFMNTGFTDAPFSEPDNFYQNGWTALAPNQSVVLSIDLTNVANLNHVSNIGFMVAGDMDQLGNNPSNPDIFHISVAPIPAPGAALLVCLGVAAVGWVKRRFA